MTDREHDRSPSCFDLIDLWPTLSNRRRSLVLTIVRALATIDMCAGLAIARYCERRAEQAANREADRVLRVLRNRITSNENRRAIRQSLMGLRQKGRA